MRHAWRILVSALLSVVVPTILVAQFPLSVIKAPALAVGSIVVYAGLRLGSLAFDLESKPLQITFYIFTYVWLGVTPLLQLITGRFPWGLKHNSDDALVAAAIVWVGLLSYDLAILIARRESQRSKSLVAAARTHSVSGARLGIAAFIALMIATAALVVSGLWRVLFLPRSTDTGLNSVMAVNLGFSLIRIPVSFVAMVAACATSDRSIAQGKRRVAMAIYVLTGMAALIVSNPISSPRVMFGSIALGLILARIRWTSSTNLLAVLGITFGLLVAFPSMDMFRSSMMAVFRSPLDSYVSKGDFDAFQIIANTVVYCRAQGHTLGTQFAGAIFFWFPRAYWFTKAYGSGALIARGLGYKFTNLSSPLWAEGFIDFGFPGTILMLFGYGYLCGRVELRYASFMKLGRFSMVRVAVSFWAGYQLFFLRGDLQNGIAYSSCFVLCLALSPLLLVRTNSRSKPSAQRPYAQRYDGGAGYRELRTP